MNALNKCLLLFATIQLLGFTSKAQALSIYSTWPIEDRQAYFVSLSDVHEYDLENQVGMLPDIEVLGQENAMAIELVGNYRVKFMSQTKVKQTDSLFYYDVITNKNFSFCIKDLKSVAILDYYTEMDVFPFTAEYYMFGFEIPFSKLDGINTEESNALVSIGKLNPFAQQQLQKIVWRPKSAADEAHISNIPMDLAIYKEYEIRPFNFKEEYVFKNGDALYYLKNLVDQDNNIFARHLYIYDVKKKQLLADRLFEETEGISLVGLAVEGNQEEYEEFQLTGKLFREKAPVIFNFTYHSFGCPTIVRLDMKEDDVYIYCDNRH